MIKITNRASVNVEMAKVLKTPLFAIQRDVFEMDL